MPIKICDAENIFGLNFKYFTPSWWNSLALLLPFSNEIAHLFDRNLFLPYFGFHSYPHHDTILKMLINCLIFTGISMNVAYKTMNTDKYMGTLTGIIYTIFAFVIPSLFFNKIINYFKYPLLRLFIGLVLIYILEFCATASICLIQSGYYNKKTRKDLQISKNL
tara:strand:+ start:1295 stop:1786 length:492 start_codon:yes stop_codon:yes gene_type:complete